LGGPRADEHGSKAEPIDGTAEQIERLRLAARSTMRGTHEGDFMGIAASGKKVEVSNFDFVRFENDQAAEHWGAIDSDAMMEQLGVAPPRS
jgi:predicted ester cyclase